MFCPRCQSALHEHELIDPSLRGYRCADGHVDFTTVVEQGVIPQADTIQPPPIEDDLQILKFWLTDPRARERLPNQLALLCRRMIDIVETNQHVARVNEPFVFCPACGQTLVPFDSNDVYMQGLRCGNAHEFWWRGSTVYFKEDDVRGNLSAELDDDFMPTLIDYYGGHDKIVEPYVHPQLRAVLKRFGR